MDNKISPIRQDKLRGRLVWTANFLKCFSFLGYGYFLQISLSEITFLSNQLVALGLLTFISPIWKTNEAGRITIWDPNHKCWVFFFLEARFQTYIFPPKGTASNTLDNPAARKASSLAKSLSGYLISGEMKTKRSQIISKNEHRCSCKSSAQGPGEEPWCCI